MDLLILSSLARVPMHGYELELELRYRHVRWWAKAEHGHMYLALARLEKNGDLAGETRGGAGRKRREYSVTEQGRERLTDALAKLGRGRDETYFAFDLFLAGSYLLPKDSVVELMHERVGSLSGQLEEARALRAQMMGKVPGSAELIIEHRVRHLEVEREFAQKVSDYVGNAKAWGPFMGSERISEFIARTGVALE
ncbi:MAG: PadR family transcriptional regulator [Deltaproteobacteria bacterium]|nr:PadR family transcriptional regulator [Deltaproteobacteria bacterium]